VLSVREQEDAANDLHRESNTMERESLFCEHCGSQHWRIFYSQLSLRCSCGGINSLPPAPPIFTRPTREEGVPPKLRWDLHGEGNPPPGVPRRSLLQDGGEYWVQWREVPPDTPLSADEGWTNGKNTVKAGKIVGKGQLSADSAYQCRVRARYGPCYCNIDPAEAEAEDDDRPPYARCFCTWSPWSLPSAAATPNGHS